MKREEYVARHLKRGMDASAIKAADVEVRETVEQILADIDARKDTASRELDERSCPFEADRRSNRISSGTDEAGDRPGGDRCMISAGIRFGCVLADAGYGMSAPFRQGLTARKLAWAVGIPRHLKVYPVGVQLIWPITKVRGRPRRRHVPDTPTHSSPLGTGQHVFSRYR